MRANGNILSEIYGGFSLADAKSGEGSESSIEMTQTAD